MYIYFITSAHESLARTLSFTSVLCFSFALNFTCMAGGSYFKGLAFIFYLFQGAYVCHIKSYPTYSISPGQVL